MYVFKQHTSKFSLDQSDFKIRMFKILFPEYTVAMKQNYSSIKSKYQLFDKIKSHISTKWK